MRFSQRALQVLSLMIQTLERRTDRSEKHTSFETCIVHICTVHTFTPKGVNGICTGKLLLVQTPGRDITSTRGLYDKIRYYMYIDNSNEQGKSACRAGHLEEHYESAHEPWCTV